MKNINVVFAFQKNEIEGTIAQDRKTNIFLQVVVYLFMLALAKSYRNRRRLASFWYLSC